jgi:hypothetical protein
MKTNNDKINNVTENIKGMFGMHLRGLKVLNFRGLLGVFSVVFSQSYVEHNLKKNKIAISFFANRLIFMS